VEAPPRGVIVQGECRRAARLGALRAVERSPSSASVLASVEQTPNRRLQILGEAWLRQEDGRARLERAVLSSLVREGGEDDHGDVSRLRVFLDAPGSNDTVDTWHREVENDHVRPRLHGCLNRRFAIRHRQNGEPVPREVHGVEFSSVEGVVRDQDESRTARTSGGGVVERDP